MRASRMRGMTLAARPAIVIPTVPAAYRKALVEHPLLMNAFELRLLRVQHFGMGIKSYAKALGVSERGIVRWESGERAPSRANADALVSLIAYTDAAVAELVASCPPNCVLVTYRTDDEFREHERTGSWNLSAEWHNGVVWRAAQQIPGARIDEAP